jgi:hypothetical protein
VRGRRAVAAAAAAAWGCGLASSPAPPVSVAYRPDRHDYRAFRERHPEVLEPNYLPFLAHAVALPGGGDALVFCRWERDRFPLPVYVAPAEIPDALQDEFAPIPAEAFVAAVEAALAAWERDLEGLVRFRRVTDARDAALRVELVAEVAPAPESTISVLGRIHLGTACSVAGPRVGDRVPVTFDAPELRLYLADDYGLLNPDQVERVAVHELGHALGMRRHSPVPADLMFPVARDSPLVRGPSEQDVNSFLSLYHLPNGSVFRLLDTEADAAPPPPPGPSPGPPRLAPAPHVDARFGYELSLPAGWQRVETAAGVIATDGPTWDYDATFQVIVRGYPTVAEYLDRYAPHYVGGGHVLEQRRVDVAGRPALRMVVSGRDGPVVEQLTFVEVGDGRILAIVADCPQEAYSGYEPLFRAVLATLEVRSLAPRGSSGPP